jgi:glyoxylase-like metal-dependent hydrolase (beta-lactamase superfamily II)
MTRELERVARWAATVAACTVLVLLAACGSASTRQAAGVQRLYVLYCGEAKIPDISPWSPGVNVGQPATFSDNCYLIRHGSDWMLWDSGYTDALADQPDGVAGPRGMRAFRARTLVSQLAEIGVTPDQVSVLAFSHTHADHVGNANLFAHATLYMQQAEYDAAFGPDPGKYGFAPQYYDKLRALKTVKLNGDYDVFGDGSVRILSTPGHTPGHQSLLVHLPKTGAVVLSGDLAHFMDNFVNRRVPGFNFDAAESRASMDRVAALVATEHAQLWINHDSQQSATIRHAPSYYE